jgi:hypothetical protein
MLEIFPVDEQLSASQERLRTLLLVGYNILNKVKALCYKPEGRGSIPYEVIGFFN